MSNELKVERLKEVWYSRNPCHEVNADSGKDMFWDTVLMVFKDLSRPTEPKEQIAEDVDEARTLLLNGKCLKGWGGITVRLHQDGDTLLSWNHKKKIWMDTRLMDVYFPPFSLASMNENWEWTVIDNPAICDEVKK